MVTVLIAPFNFRCVCVCVCLRKKAGGRETLAATDTSLQQSELSQHLQNVIPLRSIKWAIDLIYNVSPSSVSQYEWVFFSIHGSCRVNISQEDFLQAFNILACLSLKSKTDEMSQISLSLITRSLNCSFSLNEKVFLICLGFFFLP